MTDNHAIDPELALEQLLEVRLPDCNAIRVTDRFVEVRHRSDDLHLFIQPLPRHWETLDLPSAADRLAQKLKSLFFAYRLRGGTPKPKPKKTRHTRMMPISKSFLLTQISGTGPSP